MAHASVEEPFPIFKVADNYLLYDVDVVSHVRRNHNICGVLIGTLPQVPQQNVFLGTPMLLMSEEARILVEQGNAYVMDDAAAHKSAFLGGNLGDAERAAFQRAIDVQGLEAATAVQQRASDRRQQALKSVEPQKRRQRMASEDTATTRGTSTDTEAESSIFSAAGETDDTASTFTSAPTPRPAAPFPLTPTTSYPPLQAGRGGGEALLPPAPPSYPLFAHLHRLGYFMTPGLRFGCQYTVYPGDPLRFHSHFLAVGRPWDEEFRLMEIVGGGRLGTGVKKGFMLGGEPEQGGPARAFCFEWAGM